MKSQFIVDTKEIKKVMLDNDITTIKNLSECTGIGRDTLAKVLDNKIMPSSRVMFALVAGLNLNSEHAGRIFFTRKLTE